MAPTRANFKIPVRTTRVRKSTISDEEIINGLSENIYNSAYDSVRVVLEAPECSKENIRESFFQDDETQILVFNSYKYKLMMEMGYFFPGILDFILKPYSVLYF